MLGGIGFLIILACVFGSFIVSGGKIAVILEALPHEILAIGGAATGAFIVANSLPTIKLAGKGIARTFKGARWKGSDYQDLLTLLFALLSTFRNGGATAIEPHLEKPAESSLFAPYPRLLADHHLVEFICDYLRLMTVNFEDPNQISEAMENDINRHHQEELAPQNALQVVADGLPAIGIVAAVLGVIKTMASIDQPVEILGGMIGSALVGTFLGVLLSYCLVGPLAAKLRSVIDDDGQTYTVIRTAIVGHAQRLPTQVAIELARRMTPSLYAPSFEELDRVIETTKEKMIA